MRPVQGTLLALMMALGIQGAQAKEQALDSVVVVVDDSVVLQSELDRRIESISARLRQTGTQLPPADVLKQQVLDRLIVDSIQLQMATRASVQIDDKTLNDALLRTASANKISLPQLKVQLEGQGMDYSQFREDIRQELAISRLRQSTVGRRIQISEQEVENLLKSSAGQQQNNTELNLSHILVAFPSEATPDQIQAAKAEAEGIIKLLDNGKDFAQMAVSSSDGQRALEGGAFGWRKLNQLPGLFASAVEKVKPGQHSQLIRSASGYHIFQVNDRRGEARVMVTETNARHILIKTTAVVSDQQAKLQLLKLKKRLAQGESFADLASSYSQDAGSAINGGDLGWAKPGQFVPEFEQTMNRLKPNEISQPFKSQFGWHMMQLVDRRQQDSSEEVKKNQARQLIYRRKFDEELNTWLREIRDNAYVQIIGKAANTTTE
ncbi:peptidylprolyl isomerase SurA [Pelagibaculum spongiae]|uniref:Chaperone SurA n=1 Tax=Pelagibaculum spongiae TaxID=2080658 RepID=A0A2V1GYJ4_9GAMM|nr:peptidylprolyl isomerase SurA [Pelagibaculum spongiae]PVZ67744.1 peptidylprolyl isomerase SurA [Pelagibaculum spongiae]